MLPLRLTGRRTTLRLRTLAISAALPAALALGACNSDDATSPSVPGAITIQSGDAQSTTVTKAVASPLVVNVTSKGGTPLAGVKVNWRATSTLGTLADSVSETDASGNARMTFTAGQKSGTLNVTAGAGVLSVVSFTQKIVAEGAAAFTRSSGNGAAALVTSPITLAAKVSDKYGNGVSGVDVTWAIGPQGGALSALTSTTDADGIARVTLTLGATPGPYTVTAAAGNFTALTFTVTGV